MKDTKETLRLSYKLTTIWYRTAVPRRARMTPDPPIGGVPAVAVGAGGGVTTGSVPRRARQARAGLAIQSLVVSAVC